MACRIESKATSWIETKMPRSTSCMQDSPSCCFRLLSVPSGRWEPPSIRKTLLDSPPLLVLLVRGRRASGLDEGRTSRFLSRRVSDGSPLSYERRLDLAEQWHDLFLA